jgi:8-oxo-dGTP diphosphatase
MDDKRIGVGIGIMLLKGNRILLGKRHDDPEKAGSELGGAGTWTMPGGKLRFGESFEEGARREVMQETGMKLRSASLICVNNDIAQKAHFVTVGLISTEFEGDPRVMEPDEITEWRWFDLDRLPAPLFPASSKVIKNYKKKKFYIKQ